MAKPFKRTAEYTANSKNIPASYGQLEFLGKLFGNELMTLETFKGMTFFQVASRIKTSAYRMSIGQVDHLGKKGTLTRFAVEKLIDDKIADNNSRGKVEGTYTFKGKSKVNLPKKLMSNINDYMEGERDIT